MKKQSKLACTLLILCTTFAWTGCSDDDNPIRNTPTEDPTPRRACEPRPACRPSRRGLLDCQRRLVRARQRHGEPLQAHRIHHLEPVYRAYRAANDGETFGVTTQFGAIWGDNFYFTSKQATASWWLMPGH